ncbi:NADH/Ubiquinone/plastoquinone (complex I) [Ferroglobus placidus DSM 10642]|uniref:NADH/Ubiquinone/plastoquinone (Complex I) n=1 Tax=Ferroglobus placidus (strain DSM 10642 / AEDII12DO) TaxID=589924 RepID=D3RZD7_FERPA|nr:NADH-quinone oxidoreductase subunit L [Ferroglobus placidus]ADC65850.1 NADH/Ubiquinone/plastoquinone (complex I) [Ferroglobus placidus DSM 10642]
MWLWLVLLLSPIIASVPIAIAWEFNRNLGRKLPVISVAGLFVSFVITLYILLFVEEGRFSYPWLPGIEIAFIVDYLSKYMGVLTGFIAFVIGVYGLEYMKDDYRLGWYWFFFNLFTASMLMVVYSDNLLSLLIGWEGLGIASWGLIGHWFRDDDELSYVGVINRKVGFLKMFWSPSTGGWRAISTIRIGDMPMFFAVAAIFAFAGTLNISQINWELLIERIGSFGVAVLLLAFLMGPFTKSAQLPFSEWLMTAMTGPTTVSALLHSATMVAAGTYLFMRISWYVEPWKIHDAGIEFVYLLVLFLGLISSLYGALVALASRERKVLLAASTMSSLGLMFAAAAASKWIGEFAIVVAFWYLITHAFAKATLFLVAGHLIHETHDRFLCGDLEVAKKMKLTFVVTIIATVMLAGIPPLTAYWVKSAMDEVMHSLHEVGEAPLFLLIIISAVYSAFLAKFLSMNFVKGRHVHLHLHGGGLMKTGYTLMVSMLFLLLAVILLGIDEHVEEFVKAGFHATSFMVGVLVTVTYAIGFVKPTLETKIGQVLADRFYLMALNDFIVPKIGWAFVTAVDYGNKAIDFFAHRAIPGLFEVVSKGIRALQTGRLTHYVQLALGALMLLLIAVSVAGW